MARIKKQGLDYFPMSTDFIHDRLVRRIMKREGDASLSILIEALSYIYAGEGYYVRADDFFYEDLSSNLYEKTSDDVKRVITLAVEYGVFDAELFGSYSILTSADIQRQYIFSTKRRNALRLDPAYCLIDEESLIQPSRVSGASEANRRKRESVKSVKESGGELFANADEQEEESGLKANVNKTKNVTLIPENVTSGTHSIAQQSIAQQSIEKHSIAQHSVAENRKVSPPPTSSGGGTGDRKGREEEKEEIFSETPPMQPPSGKRKEWTPEAIGQLRPPADGLERNYDGLVYNLRLFGIPPTEQYAIIRKSNFGTIGGPVWKGFCSLRDSNGKIKLPGRYLLSVMNK